MMIDPENVKPAINHEEWASKFFSFDWSYNRSDDYSVWSRGDSAYRNLSQKASSEVWSVEDEIKILEYIREIYFITFKTEIKEDFYNYLVSKVHMFAEKGRNNASINK